MADQTNLQTPEQARKAFMESGISIRQWARDNGFPYHSVIAVLSRRSLCQRGTAHKIAVALAIKQQPATKAFLAKKGTPK